MTTDNSTNFYSTEAEIEAVVRGFEDCATPRDDFTHQRHLTVGVWYVWHSNATALERMRNGLLRFLSHHEVPTGKYQEELTRSWLELISQTISECDNKSTLTEVTNHVINRCGDSRLVPKAR